VAAGLVVVLLLSVVAYVKLSGNIDRIDIADALGDRPSPQATTDKNTKLAPMNILVMGSDTRKGILGGENNTDARSDTNLVVHLSADRKSAVVVSIPRDSMVKAPANCRDKNSTVDNGVVKQWNASFTEGGPACTIKTLEGNTGLFINHFMVIDFAGFREMVDALGGVTVCSPEPISDEKAHLELPAGKTKVNGRQALGYVRVRYTVGDGSDLGRINRQQAFMSSLVQEATKSSLLLRPDRLFRFLNAATNAMTADSELDLGKMKDIAESVRRIGMDQIRFVTVPTRPYSQDANRVEWTESADVIWQALREDKPLPGTKPPAGSKPTPKPSPTTSQPLTVSPGVIRVRVTNDSGVSGLARQAAEALQVQGFGVDAYVNGQGEPTKGTIIRYGRGMKEAARTVAAAFPKSQLREDNLVGSTIQVSLGMGAANVVEVPNRLGTAPLPKPTITATAPPTSTETITARAANQDICK
jgi:LCP family protein required for cell wall assembly